MISIRDEDKQRLEKAVSLLDGDLIGIEKAKHLIQVVLAGIDELGQEVPYSPATVVPMTEADKRICYPERYK